MILPTMTPEEKVAQMQKLKPWLMAMVTDSLRRDSRWVRKAKTFPVMNVLPPIDITGMGRWTVIITVGSKGEARKGIASVMAYQKFQVSHGKPENIGTGIYVFDGNDAGEVFCNEYAPHYFNRFRKREIEARRGIVQPDFDTLVRMVLREDFTGMDYTIRGLLIKENPDGTIDMQRDVEYDRQEGYTNYACYMKHGIGYGLSAANRHYFHFTTFIGLADMKPDQLKVMQEAMAHRRESDFRQQQDPFYVEGVKREFLDKNVRI